MIKLKDISILILAILSLTGLFLNIDTKAEFDIQSQQLNTEEKDILKKIENVDPQKPQRNKFKRKSGKIIDSTSSFKKEFNSSDKKVNLTKEDINIEIGTPKEIQNNNTTIQEDKIIYESKDNTVDLTIENVDGGIRQVIIIHDKNQPNRYTFPMKISESQKFVKNEDESVRLIDSNSNTVMFILKPWARDKNNKELQTYYEVEDKQIVQYINLDNAEFPVTADPTWCGDYFTDVKWGPDDVYGERKGDILGMKPTWCLKLMGMGSNVYGSFSNWSAWNELYSKIPYHQSFNWDDRKYGTNKYWSMYNQLQCHIDWIKWANSVGYSIDYIKRKQPIYRDSFHLEPFRNDKGYWGFIFSGCN